MSSLTLCGQIDALTPWVLNGTAPVADCERFEQHLIRCDSCRERVEMERTLLSRMRAAEPSTADKFEQAELAWTRFDRSLGTGSATTPAAARAPRYLRWIIAAQAAALLIFALAFVQLSTEQNRAAANYRTVTTPSSSSVPIDARERQLLRLAVDRNLAASTLEQLARDHGAVVIDGPSAQGVVTLELLPERLQQQVIDQLRAIPGILLAEPLSTPTLGSKP